MRRDITKPQEVVQMPEYNVQSVSIGYNRIIIGMRSGSIYEVTISEDTKVIRPVHDLV